MPLSCGCDFDGGDPGQTCYWYATDFEKLQTSKRKRCASCGELIDIGSYCLVFPRFKVPETDIEERIYGEEIPRAPYYHCEKCGEIWLNLTEGLGFCSEAWENQTELLLEYIHEYKPQKLETK